MSPLSQIKVVPETTETGRIINRIYRLYELTEDENPRYRGNIMCLIYSPFERLFNTKNMTKKEYEHKPLFTIGPDWKYVVIQLIVVNFITGLAVFKLKKGWMYNFFPTPLNARKAIPYRASICFIFVIKGGFLSKKFC